MHGYDTNAHIIEMRYRTERAERQATFMASLGALPKPEKLRLFSRRVVALTGPVEVQHTQATNAATLPPRAA
jgi:hypothetical protein